MPGFVTYGADAVVLSAYTGQEKKKEQGHGEKRKSCSVGVRGRAVLPRSNVSARRKTADERRV